MSLKKNCVILMNIEAKDAIQTIIMTINFQSLQVASLQTNDFGALFFCMQFVFFYYWLTC